jgi:hypothetical protein
MYCAAATWIDGHRWWTCPQVLRCSSGERGGLGLLGDLGQDAVEVVAGEGPVERASDVAIVLSKVHQAPRELLQGAEVVGHQRLALDDREEQLGLVELSQEAWTGRWISSALGCALCIRAMVFPACELALSTIQNTRRADA